MRKRTGGVVLIQVIYSGGIIPSTVRVYFSILWKILHLSTLHATTAKRKYRNWIRQTVNNENMKNSIFRKSKFPCYFGSLAAQWRLQQKPIAMHAVEFRPHSYAHAFRLWVTFDVSHWTPSASPLLISRAEPNVRGCAFMVAWARVPCASFRTLAIVQSYRVYPYCRAPLSMQGRQEGRQRKKGKERRGVAKQ